MTKRKTTLHEKTVFTYLNKLRKSGVTNMYGATPYIEKAFKIKQQEARSLLSLWMKVFNNEGNYEEIEAPELAIK